MNKFTEYAKDSFGVLVPEILEASFIARVINIIRNGDSLFRAVRISLIEMGLLIQNYRGPNG
jgi:hypothetical protein